MRLPAWIRAVVGFLMAPMAPALLLVVAGLLFGQAGHWASGIAVAALLGYPIALLLGIPLHISLMSKGWNEFWIYALAGALLGAATYLMYFPPSDYADAVPKLLERSLGVDVASLSEFHKVLLSMIFGVTATAAFWLAARAPGERHEL
jgi:hypothetical protein